MALVGLLIRLYQHEVRERPHRVRLRHQIVQLGLVPGSRKPGGEDIVDIVDYLIEICPCEVAPLDLARIAFTGLIAVVLPEPARPLGRLHHVLTHQVRGERDGEIAEALVGIGGNEVNSVVHRGIDPVHRHLDGVRIPENQILVHIRGRRRLKHPRAGRKGNKTERRQQKPEFHYLEFHLVT